MLKSLAERKHDLGRDGSDVSGTNIERTAFMEAASLLLPASLPIESAINEFLLRARGRAMHGQRGADQSEVFGREGVGIVAHDRKSATSFRSGGACLESVTLQLPGWP
jgi:hypothetical protein